MSILKQAIVKFANNCYVYYSIATKFAEIIGQLIIALHTKRKHFSFEIKLEIKFFIAFGQKRVY